MNRSDGSPRRGRGPQLLTLLVIAIGAPALSIAAQEAASSEAAPSKPESSRPESSPPGGRLTLLQAVEGALTTHPSLGTARAQRDAAAAGVAEAEAGLRPMVSLTASASQFQEPMVVTPIHGFAPGQTPQFDETLFQASLQVGYKLFDGGKTRATILQTQAEAERAGAGLRYDEQTIVAQTVSTYLSILSLREVLGAHDERLVALEAERGRVEQRLEVGRAPDVELRRVEAAVAAGRAERITFAASLETAERSLARLIGRSVDETQAHRLVAVSLAREDIPDRSRLTRLATEASPEVEQARKALRAAEAAVALARAIRRPDLEVVGKYSDFGSSRGDFSGEWSAGVRLAVPLYAGGAARQRIVAATARHTAAAERLNLAILRTGEQLDRAVAAAEEAAARRESLDEAVESFREVVRVERLRLDVGTGTQADYLDAEADLLAARARLAETRHSEIAARTELARVTGQLDLPWLRLALETAP